MAIRLKAREAPPPDHAPVVQDHAPVVQDSRPLHLRLRPATLDDVVGQKAVVSSLRKVLSQKQLSHAFLFTGPSGTGKTTLARIVATKLGVPLRSILEVDAATNSGIDKMRELTDSVRYKALMHESDRKFVIVDESHALSKSAWQSLLKSIEEPPEHVFWAFATTEADKIPDTIRTRCLCYNLKPISSEDIDEHLTRINVQEKLGVTDEGIGLIARNAAGSMRRALVYLEQARGVKEKREILELLEKTVVGEEAIALARLLCGRGNFTWEQVMALCAAMKGESAEGIRLVILTYAVAMLPQSKEPGPLLAVLSAFQGPYNQSEGFAPLYLALGSLLLNEA